MSSTPAPSASSPIDTASCRSYGSAQTQRGAGAAVASEPARATSVTDIDEVAPRPQSALSAFARAGRRHLPFAGSESSLIGLTPPHARGMVSFGGPFVRGTEAAFSLATGSLLISTGATVLAEGAYAGVRADVIAGVVLSGLGALCTVSSEHSVCRLVQPLGSDAPRGVRGAHALTNAALAIGSAMTQIGSMRGDLWLELNGLLILTGGWIGYSRTLGQIFAAIEEVRALETPIEQAVPHSARTSYDLLGSPWALAGVLLGAYALGRGLSLDSRALIATGLVLGAYGWLHNGHARNPDNRAGLFATTVGAFALGELRGSNEAGWQLIAGVVTGLGAIHALYHASTHPYAQHAAHRWYSPEHLRSTLPTSESEHLDRYDGAEEADGARAAGDADVEARGARRG